MIYFVRFEYNDGYVTDHELTEVPTLIRGEYVAYVKKGTELRVPACILRSVSQWPKETSWISDGSTQEWRDV